MSEYTTQFYDAIRDAAVTSAREIVPLIRQLVVLDRVVDIGCGDGSWLKVCAENGAKEILGVDGAHVKPEILSIPVENFRAHDLTKPLKLDRKFDLAMSLEVAEHLDGEVAAIFVESLTRLAPLILFSAAPPCQGGTGHVNEQWPEYWRDLFRQNNYVAIDYIRGKVWQNDNVEWWYAQNILIFADQQFVQTHEKLKEAYESTNQAQLSLIHPKAYLRQAALLENLDPKNRSLKQELGMLPHLVRKAVANKLNKGSE